MITNREEVVERAAKAIWLRNNTQLHSATEEQLSERWAAEPEYKKETKWRPFARAALSIAEEAVLEELMEPSRAMCLSGSWALDFHERIEDGAREETARQMADLRGDKWTDYAENVWQAMLSASGLYRRVKGE